MPLTANRFYVSSVTVSQECPAFVMIMFLVAIESAHRRKLCRLSLIETKCFYVRDGFNL